MFAENIYKTKTLLWKFFFTFKQPTMTAYSHEKTIKYICEQSNKTLIYARAVQGGLVKRRLVSDTSSEPIQQ